MITKKNIINTIKNNQEEIKKMGVKKIGIFGSFAKGKQNKKSDVDILVDFNPISFDNYMNLLFLLEKVIKRKIDLVTIPSLRPELNYVLGEAEYVKL